MPFDAFYTVERHTDISQFISEHDIRGKLEIQNMNPFSSRRSFRNW